jgi:hypothetical protein
VRIVRLRHYPFGGGGESKSKALRILHYVFKGLYLMLYLVFVTLSTISTSPIKNPQSSVFAHPSGSSVSVVDGGTLFLLQNPPCLPAIIAVFVSSIVIHAFNALSYLLVRLPAHLVFGTAGAGAGVGVGVGAGAGAGAGAGTSANVNANNSNANTNANTNTNTSANASAIAKTSANASASSGAVYFAGPHSPRVSRAVNIVVDWHNLGFAMFDNGHNGHGKEGGDATIGGVKKEAGIGGFVRAARWAELQLTSRIATGHICVSKAMRAFLAQHLPDQGRYCGVYCS